MKAVKLIAGNRQGATVAFYGKSKRDAYLNFRREYSSQGFIIEFIDEDGNSLGFKKTTYR